MKASYIGKILTSFIICLLFSPVFSSGAVLLDRIVATVNDEVITWSELMDVLLQEGRKYLEGLPEEQKQKRIDELSRPFLNNLIEAKLQEQEARRMGLSVGSAEIDSAIGEIKKKFKLSDDAFIESLRAEQLTIQDYRKKLASQILMQKAVNFAVKSKIVISDKKIDKYFAEHRDEFRRSEEMKIRQIFFALPPDESFRGEIEKKAADIYNRLLRGEDFKDIAKQYSEGPSRESGGDLGYISRGSALPGIEKVASKLKVGQISKPFWSSAGLHIIKLEDVRQGTDVEDIKDKIKEILVQKEFEKAYHTWVGSLREKANIEIRL